ncbi:MAG: DNA topoisomerase I [Candidatus Woesearchaeota archaeon]|nr:DNA topoisomerase I [Candidatus Woesearchaeota archaeon]
MVELIITEKPAAALKIAEALADGKAIKESNLGVPYYKVTHGKNDIIVACAVGHLYGLAEKEKGKWTYPVFDIEWKPTSETNKGAAFSKKYLQTIKKLSKEAKTFTVATDYDIEGEVIGLNVIRFICNQKDAARMKFSTLTKPDLIEAYENKAKTLNWGQAMAGETRHELDWYWGINTSRALTAAIKAGGMFKIMSSGRVQGPALKIIVDKEKEIKNFKPVPFWQIDLKGNVNKGDITALHKEDKFWEKEKAEAVMHKVKSEKKGLVQEVKKTQFNQKAPVPFDLTALQIEAYHIFKIQPKETLEIAQNLYLAGLISYPRTSSQQLPFVLNFKKILKNLSSNESYKKLAQLLLAKEKLIPNNGKKTDPAHPAVHPTGEYPKKIDAREYKIYDLIVKRFFATFGEDAVRETVAVDINVKNEIFIAKGTRTIAKGWHVLYEPYVTLKEEELPPINKSDIVNIDKITMYDKETQPPARFTPASIIKELEKRNLGTKSTRAQIIDTLSQRGYTTGKVIEATDLGIKTVETLEKYSPLILDEELTRHFEEEMEEIREQKKKPKEILEEAKAALIKILNEFKGKEKKIGEGLKDTYQEQLRQESEIGKCPKCEKGTLKMRKGRFGRFIACDQYPECKTTFKLPSSGLIKPSEKICEQCKYPMIMVIMKGKRPQEICINKECPSKQIMDAALKKEAEKIESGKIERKCPKCGTGNLVLRKSVYGSFYGCSTYPKCRHIEKIETKSQNVKNF